MIPGNFASTDNHRGHRPRQAEPLCGLWDNNAIVLKVLDRYHERIIASAECILGAGPSGRVDAIARC